MEENREISLIINEEVVFSIPLEKRELKGSEVIKLLDYRLGKVYEVKMENPYLLDEKVLNEVHSVISELTANLMELKESDFEYVPQTEEDEIDSRDDMIDNENIPY